MSSDPTARGGHTGGEDPGTGEMGWEGRGGDKRVLIADDDEGVRQLIRMTLQREEYQILEASDGEEALALAYRHRPHVILLDVMMPKVSGFDVCRQLKEDPATAAIPILMLTVKGQEDDFEEAEIVGADAYFVKPFSPIALLKKVEEIVA